MRGGASGRAAGIETDIMETHSLYSKGWMVCGNLFGGYGRDYVPFDHFRWTLPPSGDGDWHIFGCEWGKPDPDLFKVPLPDFFEVDYVRVYDRAQPQRPLPELPVKKVELPEGEAGDETVMAARRRVAKLSVMGVETCRREADDAEILHLRDILSAALDRALAEYKPGDNAKEKAFAHIKSSRVSCEKIMRARQ